jgi:hypothetical protein
MTDEPRKGDKNKTKNLNQTIFDINSATILGAHQALSGPYAFAAPGRCAFLSEMSSGRQPAGRHHPLQ